MSQQQTSPTPATNPDKWKPGRYKAHALDWGVTKTKAGLPQVIVLFEYEQSPGERRELMWFGSFKDGALARTEDTLFMLGLRQAPYPAMESGRDGKALDEKAEVEIVVEHRLDQNGVKRAGISWVNPLGGRGIDSKLAQGEGQAMFAQANQSFMAKLMQEGAQVQQAAGPTQQSKITQPQQGTLDDADIPF